MGIGAKNTFWLGQLYLFKSSKPYCGTLEVSDFVLLQAFHNLGPQRMLAEADRGFQDHAQVLTPEGFQSL